MKILILYYSQSGQLLSILQSICKDISHRIEIDYVPIEPATQFPFPWTAAAFFDCMPECVLGIPEPIKPVHIPNKNYDLVLLGYQPWFLSPSIPVRSFLMSEYAKFIQGKKVVTVIGSRNMWLHAQERVKEHLQALGAQLVGNIAFYDSNPNLVSILSFIRWCFQGQKKASRFLPEAGVQQIDIERANRFGPLLIQSSTNELHANLLQANAVNIKPGLVILEQRGVKSFKKFAAFIIQRGERGNAARQSRVLLFQRLLFIGVFVLSPISNLTAFLQTIWQRKKLQQQIQYFKKLAYKQNAF